MTIYSLDTNAVLRYLLNDVTVQAQQVDKLFTLAKDLKCRVIVKSVVFVETVFVLTKSYGLNRAEVASQLSGFLSIPYIEFDDRDLLSETLSKFSAVTVSFVDLMLAVDAQKTGKTLITFDKRLQKLNV